MNLLSFSLNLLQMIKPVEQSIPDPLRQAISLSDKYDTYVEISIRDTIKKGELLLCVGPGRSFLRIFISSPAHTAEQNTFLTESHVNFNAQKIHPLFCCLDSPDLALLFLSRNAGLPLPALCDREREREREGPEMDYFLEGQTVNEFQYNPCINHIHITWFKLLNQLPLVLSLFEGLYRMGTMVAHSAS